MSFDDSEMMEVFIQESTEHLDSLEPDLLKLEGQSNDKDLVNRIFRSVHTIKGSSGFFGLKNISSLAHVMENAMSLVREQKLIPTEELVDAFLSGTDKLRIMVNDPNNSESVDTSNEKKIIEAILNNEGATIQAPTALNDKQWLPKSLQCFNIDGYILKESLTNGHLFYVVTLYTHKDIKDKGKKPLDFFYQIASFGEYLDSFTDITEITGLGNALNVDLACKFFFSSAMDNELIQMAWDIPKEQVEKIDPEIINRCIKELSNAQAKANSLSKKVSQSPSTKLLLETLTVTEPTFKEAINHPEEIKKEVKSTPNIPKREAVKEHPPVEVEVHQQSAKVDETVRISVALLDDLMNLAGEMVLGRNQLIRLLGDSITAGTGLGSVMQNIELITSELQEKVMQTRLQPIGNIFGKFTRIIRDLSHKLEKDVNLHITGEDVELDKSIVQMLSDPLTHLIRNAIDHGIELPEDRVKAGKPRSGSVKLIAAHVGGQVHIQVWDDGKGMDPEVLKRKAIEKGLMTQEEADKMSDQDALQIIFLPGFSTAAEISDVSGRGVGMDVVRTNIEKLGGIIDVTSVKGKFSSVCLKLPLTLAIIPAMIVGARDRRFAVPQIHLDEIVGIGEKYKIEAIRGSLILRLRDKLLPLVDLATLLEMDITDSRNIGKSIENETADHSIEAIRKLDLSTLSSRKKGYILVLKSEQGRFGLLIDKIHDSEEIVVKPMSDYLQNTKCYSGTTIMGDGCIAMILDPSNIAHAANLEFSEFEDERNNESKNSNSLNAETQAILLFKSGHEETFAMNISMISRIEKIKKTDIEHFGSKEFITYRNASLRLIRLHDFIDVSKSQEDNEHLFIIIPKLVKKPMGIVATEVLDAVQCSLKLDEETIHTQGILGSTLIHNHMTLFVDIYTLFEKADPSQYEWKKESNILKGKRILVAEDTEFFRAVIERYLIDFEIQVDAFINGKEALMALEKKTYDMVLTDIEMPIMNGFELAEKIRSHPKFHNMPIIALTSLSDDEHKKQGEQVGFNAYQVKLDKEQLRETIETVFRSVKNPSDKKSSTMELAGAH